jgi:TonB family protein
MPPTPEPDLPMAPSTPPTDEVPSGAFVHIVKQAQPHFKRCYAHSAQKSGKVVLHITVGANGRVSAASVASSTLGDPAAEACMSGVARALKFPAHHGHPVEISLPLTFASAP